MNRENSYRDRYWLHFLLFLLTLASTVYAGGAMAGRSILYARTAELLTVGGWSITSGYVRDGLLYGGSLLAFLTVHEFGHYLAARYHRVNTSLPYYIPFPFNGIGTFGAVIRIREQVPTMRKLFDIGAAGPIAGFVVALAVLVIALVTLPGPEYMLDVPGHEALDSYISQHGAFPDEPVSAAPASGQEDGVIRLVVGMTPLYWLLTRFFADVPPMWEMYHYPMLFAGWLGLFFTALNLLPVGQLDGGHILYALVGPRWHGILARSFVMLLLFSGGLGFVTELGPALYGMGGLAGAGVWLILGLILYFYTWKIFNGRFDRVVPALLGLVVLVAAASNSQAVVNRFAYSGWLIWVLLIVSLIKVDHPPVMVREPLTPRRKAVAVLGMIIFALCFSMRPLYIQ
jgi:membrane-associated protease RseP (regulator of RpoE activity)